MKKQLLWIPVSIALVISACNKEDDDDGQEQEQQEQQAETLKEVAKDQSLAQNLWDDVGNQTEGSSGSVEAEDSTWNNCATVTVDTLGNPWPFSVTVDFGTEGCLGRDGRTRKGKLIYEINDWYRNTGSTIITTPENYYVDDHLVEGTRTVTNQGKDTEDNTYFDVVVEDATVTDPDGAVIQWSSKRTRTWVEGEDTRFFTSNGNGGFLGWDGITDDVYEITGSSEGTNRSGTGFTIDIDEALRVQLDCQWITSGMTRLTPTNLDSWLFNYGDGTCDSKATLETPLGEQEIDLR